MPDAADRAALRDARAFLRAVAADLEGIRKRAADQRGRLERTPSYRAALADESPRGTCRGWDLAGTCVVVEDGLEDLATLLRPVRQERPRPARCRA